MAARGLHLCERSPPPPWPLAVDALSNPSPPLLQTVQQRGAAVIKARKLSSAMSAAKAICDHMRDIWFGTKEVGRSCVLLSSPPSETLSWCCYQ